MKKNLLYALLLYLSINALANSSDNFSMKQRPIPDPIYGVTIDRINNSDEIIESLSRLPMKPTTRIVFDTHMPAEHYKETVRKLHNVSYIMGEILDSCSFSKYSVKEYKERTHEYLQELGDTVDIWEIGNEVNGKWLGKINDVKNKMIEAYRLAKKQNKKVALTLHYDEGIESPEYEMFTWAEMNIPKKMKNGLDYVFVSYYGEHFPDTTPNWQQVFEKLHAVFPNAKIGFGEIGTADDHEKAYVVREFYPLRINVPNYVGGYFWWYFAQDMVPHTKPLWSILANAMEDQKRGYVITGEENYPDLAKGIKNVFWSIGKITETPRNFRFPLEETPNEKARKEAIKALQPLCGSEE